MKGIVLIVLTALIIGGGILSPAHAEPIDLGITKFDLPDAQVGSIISCKKQGVEATLTAKAFGKDFSWGTLSWNIGGAPAINEPITSLTYKIPVGITKKWGVDVPYAKLFDIQAGVYAGFEVNEYRMYPEKEWYEAIDYGVATISVSFKV